MERVSKLKKLSDTRCLLRLCFTRLPSASQVPLEVWRDNVVLETDLRTMTLLAQTCKAFWELVEEIRRCNVRVALVYRQYDQIPLARRCLKMCARNGVAEAMFHLGYAKMYGGFGMSYHKYNTYWIEKAAEAGSYIAMVMYGHIKYNTNNYWYQEALSSKDNLACGYYFLRVFPSNDRYEKARLHLEKSANEGNEFGQYWLSECNRKLSHEMEITNDKWMNRAAKQGLFAAQAHIGKYDYYWIKRAKKQLKRLFN